MIEFAVALKLFSYAFESVLFDVTQDALMASPLTVAIAMVQFLIILSGETFTEFVVAFYLIFVVQLVAQIHLREIVKSIKKCLGSIMMCIRKIFRIPEPVQSTAGILDEIGKMSSLEPLVWIIQNYSLSFLVLLSAPVMLLIVQYFNIIMKIDKYYEIDDKNEWMYLLFGCLVIPVHMILDVVLLNVQELFHGHRVYEYIAYSIFRFKTRKVRWQLHEPTMDSGVQRQFRTLDLVSFSSQYYFSTFFSRYGCLLCHHWPCDCCCAEV
jgi:hypothetical protein